MLGQHALVLKRWLEAHHEGVEVVCAAWRAEVKHPSPGRFDAVVALCAGIARGMQERGRRVDRSAIVSELYWSRTPGAPADLDFVASHLAALDRLAVVNEPFRQRLLTALPGREVHRVRQFVDLERFRPTEPLPESWRERFGKRFSRPKGLVAGWCGDTHKPVKRFDLVRALQREPRLPGIRWQLATKAHQQGRFVPNELMPAWYARLDVLVNTSESEGNPMPPLEALACGVPVLTTRVGVMPEAVQEGRNGWFAESREEFAAHLARLAQKPEVVRAGKAYARESLVAAGFQANDALPGWRAALFPELG